MDIPSKVVSPKDPARKVRGSIALDRTQTRVPDDEPPSSATPSEFSNPNRYELRREHARGGIGRVIEAVDRQLDRTVAIKELLVGQDRSEARFLREAKITAQLEHPSIVPVHDAGRFDDGRPFYAMKLIGGRSLREAIADCEDLAGRLALVPDVLAVSEAIAYAHSQRVVHRDLKPSNILLGPYGETVVIDWGIAKSLDADEPATDVDASPFRAPARGSLTRTGTIMGTPAYMSPEQARGGAIDERADVYALGALLYHVLTGSRPFGQLDPADLPEALDSRSPVPLHEVEPRIPRDLSAITTKAMAREPDDRYRDAGELAADLRRFQTGRLVRAHAYSAGDLVGRFVRKYRLPIAIASLAVVALLAVGIVSYRRVAASEGRAKEQLTSSLIDQGYDALSSAELTNAVEVLWRAHELGVADHPGLRFALARALAPFRGEVARFDPDVHRLWDGAFSPDGKNVVLSGQRGVVELWNVESRDRIATLAVHENLVSRARYAPDGNTIVTADDDGVVGLWSPTGQRRAVLRHGAAVYGVRISPDSKLLATGDAKGVIRLWALEDGRQVASVAGHEGQVSGFWFAGDSIYSTGNDQILRSWSVPTLEVRHAFERHLFDAGSAGGPVVSADGRRLATASAGSPTQLWNLETRELIGLLEGERGNRNEAHFSRDGRLLITTGRAAAINVWSAETGRLVRSLDGHRAAVMSIAVSPDGRLVASGGYDGTVRLWDVDRGVPVALVGEHNQPIFRVVFSPRGDRVLSVSWDGTARLWDTTRRDLEVLAKLDGPFGSSKNVDLRVVGARSLVADEERVLVIERDQIRELWRAAPGEKLVCNHYAKGLGCAVATAPSEVVWVTTAPALYRARGGSLERTSLPAPVGGVAIDRRGDIAVLYGDGSLGPPSEAPTAASAVDGAVVSVSANRDILVAQRENSKVAIWDLDSRREVVVPNLDIERLELRDRLWLGADWQRGLGAWSASGERLMWIELPEIYVLKVAIHPTQQTAVLAADDGFIRELDMETRSLAAVRHRGFTFDAVYAADGELLLTAASAGLEVWSRGRQAVWWSGDFGPMITARFDPDHERLLAVRRDGLVVSIRIPDLTASDLDEVERILEDR